jgi:hypothetical protein
LLTKTSCTGESQMQNLTESDEKSVNRLFGELQSDGLSCSNHPSWTLRERLVHSLSDAPISWKKGGSMAVAPPTAKLTPQRRSFPLDCRYGGSSGRPNACAARVRPAVAGKHHQDCHREINKAAIMPAGQRHAPRKSTTRRPSEQRPVGRWK